MSSTIRSNDFVTELDAPSSTRLTETSALSTPDFNEFYARLKKIRDYHLKYPDQPADPFSLELGGLIGEDEDLNDVEENEDRESLRVCATFLPADGFGITQRLLCYSLARRTSDDTWTCTRTTHLTTI